MIDNCLVHICRQVHASTLDLNDTKKTMLKK